MDRRRFIESSLALAAGALTRANIAVLTGQSPARRILVLGGTGFLGPAIVEAAVTAGHEVTLFNRGITNPGLFPTLERVRGTRSIDPARERLDGLRGRTWDAVVDVWPFEPALAESAARTLGARTAHYLYVSSIAAYDPRGFAQAGLTEDAALNPFDSRVRPYNRGKAESERRLSRLIGDALTIVPPGPIKGYRDTTPDLLAWLRRASAGGRHIGPGDGSDHVQLADVKDIGRFLVHAIERSLYGTYNLTGRTMTFREFVAQCAAVMRSSAQFLWIPREFLHEQGLDPAPFNSPSKPSYLGVFPFWHPEPERRGFFQVSSSRAFAAGWVQRPFFETATDYLAWLELYGPRVSWADELSPEREAAVIDRYLAANRR